MAKEQDTLAIPTAALIPTSAQSIPFGGIRDHSIFPAELVGTKLFDAHDYVEEEFLISGTTKVYAGAKLVRESAPYATRILVRRPADRKNFSGAVHVDPFHPLIEGATWGNDFEYLLRSGHAWVGVTVNAGSQMGEDGEPTGGVGLLKKLKPQRYGNLNVPEAGADDFSSGGALLSRFGSSGKDIITQVGALLKTGGVRGLMPGYVVERIYARGGSATGYYWMQYLDDGHHGHMDDGRPIFDAYVIWVASKPKTRLSDALIVSFVSEAEVTGFPRGFPLELIPVGDDDSADSDSTPYRHYELPGDGHNFPTNSPVDNTSDFGSVAVENLPIKPPTMLVAAVGPHIAHINKLTRPLVFAVYDNVDQWVRNRTPLPPGVAITRDPSAPDKVSRDEHGNALGGIRTPWVEAPDAQYFGRCPAHSQVGGMIPFDDKKMVALYPRREDYVERVSAAVDKLVAQRFLLPQDADLMKIKK